MNFFLVKGQMFQFGKMDILLAEAALAGKALANPAESLDISPKKFAVNTSLPEQLLNSIKHEGHCLAVCQAFVVIF